MHNNHNHKLVRKKKKLIITMLEKWSLILIKGHVFFKLGRYIIHILTSI